MEAEVLSGIDVICTSTLAAFRRVAGLIEVEQGLVSLLCDLENAAREVQLFFYE
jgi:hypothetical protein